MDELFRDIYLSSWITLEELDKFDNYETYSNSGSQYAEILYKGKIAVARIVDI